LINVDYSHLFNRGIHAAKNDILSSENYNYAPHVILNMLLNIASQFGASRENPMVICADAKPSWRHEYYIKHCRNFPEYSEAAVTDNARPNHKFVDGFQTYKGQRVKDADFNWDLIHMHNTNILAALKAHTDFHVIEVPLAEADDSMAVISKHAARSQQVCFNVTSDKDLRQTQDLPWVRVFDPMKKIFVTEADIKEFKRYHILIGDKSDNIKACRPKLGEKTAEKMLPTLLEHLKLDPEMVKRYKFNRVMIDMDYIPESIQAAIMEEYEQPHFNYNAMKMMKYLSEFNCGGVVDRINLFKLPMAAKVTPLNSQHERAMQTASQNPITDLFGEDD
jgi:5'-3' exonuclease